MHPGDVAAVNELFSLSFNHCAFQNKAISNLEIFLHIKKVLLRGKRVNILKYYISLT